MFKMLKRFLGYEKVTIIEYRDIDDKLHRDNNLPAVIYFDGREEYWVNGERIK